MGILADSPDLPVNEWIVEQPDKAQHRTVLANKLNRTKGERDRIRCFVVDMEVLRVKDLPTPLFATIAIGRRGWYSLDS